MRRQNGEQRNNSDDSSGDGRLWAVNSKALGQCRIFGNSTRTINTFVCGVSWGLGGWVTVSIINGLCQFFGIVLKQYF